jgi:hypothetical protein
MSTGGDPIPLGSLTMDASGLVNAAKQADAQFAKLAQSIQRSMEAGSLATQKLANALGQVIGQTQGSTNATTQIAGGIQAAAQRMNSGGGQNVQLPTC